MDLVKENGPLFTFTTEKPSEQFIISLEVAQQCAPIKNMFDDTKESNLTGEWQLHNNSTQVFEFVYYLQNIHRKNALPNLEDTKEENTEKKLLDTILREQTKTLPSTQLVNLFTIVDDLNIIDKNDHCYITDEVADRIINNPAQADIFYTLNNRSLFRNVVQNINKRINLEKKYIEPYANIAVEQHDLERTVPLLTTAWYNISNALTMPLRFFISRPWTTKTVMRPYYLNNETGTIITAFVQKFNPQDRIIRLLITNKNTRTNISVSLDLNNISTIKNIEANAAESLFICRTNDNKAIIINTLNKENTIIDQDFIDCVFSNNDHELYVIKNNEFGIWNTQDNTFKLINHLTSKTYTDIKINKQRTIAALCCDKMETWIWKCEETPFKENVKKIFQSEFLCNICLHPSEDILYIQYYDFKDSVIRTLSVNITTKKITPLDLCIPETAEEAVVKNKHSFRFLSGTDDILFAGTPHGKDYFINTKNNHIWTQKKNKNNERIFGIRETNTDNDYERITLSTDGTQSIEQTIKAYPLIDFISILTANDNNPANLSFRKILATTLIDKATIQSIKAINEGFYLLKW